MFYRLAISSYKYFDTDLKRKYRKNVTLAIMAKINKDLTGDSFNAHNIADKAANCKFNFKIMSEETMRKYIAPARELLGLPRVYENNNKTIPKN